MALTVRVWRTYPSLGVALAATIVLWLLFHAVILHPADYLFGGGDGMKNYYTLAYYVKYDHGTHFTGMNYPFGEEIVFTDNQPVLALLLRFINAHMIALADFTPGIINLLMLASIPASCVVLFWIMRLYQLPRVYSGVVAIALGFLSPQVQRFAGHYALSYTFFVPLVWYCILRMYEGDRLAKWSGIAALVGTVFVFIHVYYALIAASLLLAFLALALVERRPARARPTVIAFMVPALVPFAAIRLYLALTDHVTDRPTDPPGLYEYKASLQGVLFPSFGPVRAAIDRVVRIYQPDWAGQYIGMTGTVVLVIMIVLALRSLTHARWRAALMGGLPRGLAVSLWAAVGVLLLSAAYPFRWHMEFLLDWVPPLKQFRSLDRLAWVFYYVFTVCAAYTIHRWGHALYVRGRARLGAVIVSGLVVAWLAEAYINVNARRTVILSRREGQAFFGSANPLATQLAAHHVDPREFQAVLSFPFFLVGAEVPAIAFAGTEASFSDALQASYALHLPMASGMMSRTSLRQSLEIAQLLAGDGVDKPILGEYASEKPLLLITTDEARSPRETVLVARADSLFAIGRETFYRLPLSAFRTPG